MSEFLNFAKYLLDESAKIIIQYYRKALQIEEKPDHSPVTTADRKTEERLRELIYKQYLKHGIIGEEFGVETGNSEYTWVLDPIDGTKSFIHGTPFFGTLVALLRNDVPVMGAMGLPVLKEILISDGKNTTLNDLPVQMRKCSELAEATLLTTDQQHINKYKDFNAFNILAE
jgi:fructose-1,6-bisphosphatase/inositol monophosphatase family enzyme